MNLLLAGSVADFFSTVLYILIAVLVLLVMITVHEFGHYVVGKAFKFKINEFSIGFGPAIIKKVKKDGEVFSVRALPLGGYCAFAGEDDEGEKEGDFNTKPPYQRILVLIAGATMNFLTAILIVCIFFGA
ncbi:MAG: site-2 protease family protein [Clostridia bacterium]|nr:site-2 protease family protein [Clostridia bacterium]